MLKFADLVERDAKRLATLESLPTGKPVSPTMHFDIAHMAEVYRCKIPTTSQKPETPNS